MIPSIEPTYLTMLCDILGGDGLINDKELKNLLEVTEIVDVSPAVNKRRRIYNALLAQQERDISAENVSAFLNKVTYHIQRTRGVTIFENYLQDMNAILLFSGYMLHSDGKIEKLETTKKGRVFSQAEQRLKEVREWLIKHEAHPDLIASCHASLLNDTNYYGLVQNAARDICEKIKAKGNLAGVGAELADQAFSMGWQGYPMFAFNSLRKESEIAEQYAFLHLTRGFLGFFYDERTRLERPAFKISLGEALSFLMMASVLHQRIDESVPTPR